MFLSGPRPAEARLGTVGSRLAPGHSGQPPCASPTRRNPSRLVAASRALAPFRVRRSRRCQASDSDFLTADSCRCQASGSGERLESASGERGLPALPRADPRVCVKLCESPEAGRELASVRQAGASGGCRRCPGPTRDASTAHGPRSTAVRVTRRPREPPIRPGTVRVNRQRPGGGRLPPPGLPTLPSGSRPGAGPHHDAPGPPFE